MGHGKDLLKSACQETSPVQAMFPGPSLWLPILGQSWCGCLGTSTAASAWPPMSAVAGFITKDLQKFPCPSCQVQASITHPAQHHVRPPVQITGRQGSSTGAQHHRYRASVFPQHPPVPKLHTEENNTFQDSTYMPGEAAVTFCTAGASRTN